jgi:hypothetical protein
MRRTSLQVLYACARSRPTLGQTLAALNYFGQGGRIIELTFIHMQLLLNDKLRRSAITCARHALFKQGGLASFKFSIRGNFPSRSKMQNSRKSKFIIVSYGCRCEIQITL